MHELPPNAPDWLRQMMEEMPWHAPSHWYNYRCRSCDYRDWVDDIIVDGFEKFTFDPYINSVVTLNSVGESVLHRLVRAIVGAPAVDATFSDIAQAMLEGELDASWRQIIARQFRRRGISFASPADASLARLSRAEATCGEYCGAGPDPDT